jgi:Na+-driven multidrug efflux pump
LLQGVQGGVIRGIGLQGHAFICAAVCYYLIGLPVGGTLMFKTALALKGSWLGIACGSVFVNCAFFVLLIRSKWDRV